MKETLVLESQKLKWKREKNGWEPPHPQLLVVGWKPFDFSYEKYQEIH